MSGRSKDENVSLFSRDLQCKIRRNNVKLFLFQAGVEDKIDIRIKPAVETLGKDEIQLQYIIFMYLFIYFK